MVQNKCVVINNMRNLILSRILLNALMVYNYNSFTYKEIDTTLEKCNVKRNMNPHNNNNNYYYKY